MSCRRRMHGAQREKNSPSCQLTKLVLLGRTAVPTTPCAAIASIIIKSPGWMLEQICMKKQQQILESRDTLYVLVDQLLHACLCLVALPALLTGPRPGKTDRFSCGSGATARAFAITVYRRARIYLRAILCFSPKGHGPNSEREKGAGFRTATTGTNARNFNPARQSSRNSQSTERGVQWWVKLPLFNSMGIERFMAFCMHQYYEKEGKASQKGWVSGWRRPPSSSYIYTPRATCIRSSTSPPPPLPAG
jgi:hypothetical protein